MTGVDNSRAGRLSVSIRHTLLELGWSDLVVKTCERLTDSLSESELLQQLTLFGSPIFQTCFRVEARQTALPALRQLLWLSLRTIGLVTELTDDTVQLNQLLQGFWPDLTPHDRFWGDFSAVVQRVFTGESMRDREDTLARLLHQLRYVFSAQQANWLRQTYGTGRGDREALVAYLATSDARDTILERLGLAPYDYELTYDLTESARLHNKRGRDRTGQSALPIFPDNHERTNLKILINWHTEFILTSEGDFALVVDGLATDQNAVLNGASFNYASKHGKRHLELDVYPVGAHDPQYRRRCAKTPLVSYRSPNRCRLPFQQAWRDSFYNPRGFYSSYGKSSAKCVREMAKALQSAVNQAKKR